MYSLILSFTDVAGHMVELPTTVDVYRVRQNGSDGSFFIRVPRETYTDVFMINALSDDIPSCALECSNHGHCLGFAVENSLKKCWFMTS